MSCCLKKVLLFLNTIDFRYVAYSVILLNDRSLFKYSVDAHIRTIWCSSEKMLWHWIAVAQQSPFNSVERFIRLFDKETWSSSVHLLIHLTSLLMRYSIDAWTSVLLSSRWWTSEFARQKLIRFEFLIYFIIVLLSFIIKKLCTVRNRNRETNVSNVEQINVWKEKDNVIER